MASSSPDHFQKPMQPKVCSGMLVADDWVAMDAAAFAEQVTGLDATLSSASVGNGDVFAAMRPNRIEIIIAMIVAWQLRAAFTPINPALAAREAMHQLRDSATKVVLVRLDETSKRSVQEDRQSIKGE